MLILADTNIWVHHLHQGDARLKTYLKRNQVVMHPMVLGELACSSLKQRETVLNLLSLLPEATQAEDSQVLAFLNTHQLYSKGLGWVDMHLLCATALTSTYRLWTRDRRLHEQAVQLNLHLEDSQ